MALESTDTISIKLKDVADMEYALECIAEMLRTSKESGTITVTQTVSLEDGDSDTKQRTRTVRPDKPLCVAEFVDRTVQHGMFPEKAHMPAATI